MSVVKLFKSLHLQFFSYCQTKLGTHDLFPNTLNNEQIFKILIFKFFGDFFKSFTPGVKLVVHILFQYVNHVYCGFNYDVFRDHPVT